MLVAQRLRRQLDGDLLVLERCIREQLDDEPSSSRTLDRTFSAMKRMTSSGNRHLEVVDGAPSAQDRDAVLEVRGSMSATMPHWKRLTSRASSPGSRREAGRW